MDEGELLGSEFTVTGTGLGGGRYMLYFWGDMWGKVLGKVGVT